MVDFVVKLTKDATKVWKNDTEALRAAGFGGRAILQITLIASRMHWGWGGSRSEARRDNLPLDSSQRANVARLDD